MEQATGNVGGALQVTDDGQSVRIEHAHVGAMPPAGAMDPHAPRPNVTGNAAGSSISNAAPMMLVPSHMLEDGQRVRFPSIIGGAQIGQHSAIVGEHSAIVGCPCSHVPVSELRPDQIQRIGDFWGDAAQAFSTGDHVFDQVWQVARPLVPYGDAIDAVHRARMGLMYGNEGAGAGRAQAQGASDRAITDAQNLTRRSRKGDKTAQQQLVQIKEAAARGDANAVRTWRVIVLVSRDDDARIASSSSRPTSSSSRTPAPTSQPSGLASLFGGGGGGLLSSFGSARR